MMTVIQPYPVQTLFRTDLHKIIYPTQGKEAKNHTDPVSPREVLEGEISQGLLFSRMSVSLTKHTFMPLSRIIESKEIWAGIQYVLSQKEKTRILIEFGKTRDNNAE